MFLRNRLEPASPNCKKSIPNQSANHNVARWNVGILTTDSNCLVKNTTSLYSGDFMELYNISFWSWMQYMFAMYIY